MAPKGRHCSMEYAMDLGSVFQRLKRGIALRHKYTPTAVPREKCGLPETLPPSSELRAEFRNGLVHLVHGENVLLRPTVTVDEFYDDMAEIFMLRTDGSVGTFCFQRLRLLQTKFELYMMANFDLEQQEQMSNAHRDFYNVRKVDTHIHHSAAMNGKHLLRFIKKKVRCEGGATVMTRAGRNVTLSDVFKELGMTGQDISLDRLNVMADQTVYQRFDRFNNKYNPMDTPDLRTIFLKTDNEMQGKWLAEITRELLDDLEESKYQHTEWRLSIYGRKRDEWAKLSKWVLNNNLVSSHNHWMIQIPRLYSVYRGSGQIGCFQDMLDNIFLPMFEATLNPEAHPEVVEFMSMISGFDSVDDESKSQHISDRTFSSRDRSPKDWDIHENPSYKYYNFYLQSNLRTLNRLRASLGLNQFAYRPHAGEAGELHHLDAAFLLADGVAHGLNLRKSMPLQYLFYLTQIGIAMSPCSNNHLFVAYQKTPFHDFFMRGLNISLSTDDPLMFHQTKEPLMEEYSLAKQFFRLSSADLCELARNSVLQSGFPDQVKTEWIGSPDAKLNNILKTNVPHLRLKFRHQCHSDEMRLVHEEVDDAMMAFRAAIPKAVCTGTSPELVLMKAGKNGMVDAAPPFELPRPLVADSPKGQETRELRRNGSATTGAFIATPGSMAPCSADFCLFEQLELPPTSILSPAVEELESPKATRSESASLSPRMGPRSAKRQKLPQT
eukprot:TRINITY_DN6555_c0_g4_i1.p1 TRINITY_DN6555_c0_g4~~TRINITY_DN6555_c0_g4_i1.p1  ORF type:complete len:721 (-),score=145.91 TRINITY_DN6555_c0_g4_i1:115-2277(-)